MKSERWIVKCLCVLWVGLVAASYLYGQEIPQASSAAISLQQQYKPDLDEFTKKIHGWERKANILVTLTLLVGVLGVVTGVVQGYNKAWCKAATVLIGATISCITLFNNTFFDTDHRTLRHAAREVHKELKEIQRMIENCDGDPNEGNRRSCREDIQKKLKALDDLEETIIYKPKASLHIVKTAYAHAIQLSAIEQYQQPAWASKLPVDNINFYFVGVDDNASLEEARKNSLAKAVEQAARFLAAQVSKVQMPPSKADMTPAFREYVNKTAETADTYFSYDRSVKMYRYYTLLKLNKRFAEPDYLNVVGPSPKPWPSQGPVPSPPPRVEGRMRLSWDLKGLDRAGKKLIPVKATNEKDGSFEFGFSLKRPDAERIHLRLDEIIVHKDGGTIGPFPHRWRFEVLVDNKLAFSLPERRYSDALSPPRYKIRSSDRAEANIHVSPGANFEIRIKGYRHKDGPP